MAVVQIKGGNQKVRFPDGMQEDQMLSALRNQFPSTDRKVQEALTRPTSTISNRDVTFAEKTKQKIANFLFDNKVVSDRYGAQRIGDNLSSLLGAIPGFGDAQAGDEFGRAVAEGDGLGIGIGAVSAIPIIGDVAGKGIKQIARTVKSPFAETFDGGERLEVDGSHIDVVQSKWAPYDNSIVEFLTDESSRGQGKGGVLLDEAIAKYGDSFGGAFSSKESVTMAHNRGFRPLSNPDATLDQSLASMKENSSVTMKYMGETQVQALDDAFNAVTEQSSKRIVNNDGDVAGKGLKNITERTVYHGSGANFDTPSLNYYGTGEGGEGYGYGFHTTNSLRTGDNYAYPNPTVKINGVEFYGNTEENPIAQSILDNGYNETLSKYSNARKIKIVESLKDANIEDMRSKGKVYQYEISPSDFDSYLDFTKPISEQNEKIKNSLSEAGELKAGNETGEDLYYRISEETSGDKEASEYLDSLGIRGIKYADKMEDQFKMVDKGNYNYTVFSPERLIKPEQTK